MDEIRILAESALFAGIDGAEIDAMLRRLSPRRRRYRARRSQTAGQSRRSGQEIAAGNAFVLKSCHGYSPFCTLSMVVPPPTSTGCKSAPA